MCKTGARVARRHPAMTAVSSAGQGQLGTPTESRWTLNSGHRSLSGFLGCWLLGLTLTGFVPVSSRVLAGQVLCSGHQGSLGGALAVLGLGTAVTRLCLGSLLLNRVNVFTQTIPDENKTRGQGQSLRTCRTPGEQDAHVLSLC